MLLHNCLTTVEDFNKLIISIWIANRSKLVLTILLQVLKVNSSSRIFICNRSPKSKTIVIVKTVLTIKRAITSTIKRHSRLSVAVDLLIIMIRLWDVVVVLKESKNIIKLMVEFLMLRKQ